MVKSFDCVIVEEFERSPEKAGNGIESDVVVSLVKLTCSSCLH